MLNTVLGEQLESHTPQVPWLAALYRVDTAKVKKDVTKLQHKFPRDDRRALTTRLIDQKMRYLGALGFLAGVIPLNVPLLAFDLWTNLRVQAELVYEIAYLHDRDLSDPTRKGELLWVLGLGWGSDRAVQWGIKGFGQTVLPLMTEHLAKVVSAQVAERVAVGVVPVAGALLGASANVAFLYLVGQAAQKFYTRNP